MKANRKQMILRLLAVEMCLVLLTFSFSLFFSVPAQAAEEGTVSVTFKAADRSLLPKLAQMDASDYTDFWEDTFAPPASTDSLRPDGLEDESDL